MLTHTCLYTHTTHAHIHMHTHNGARSHTHMLTHTHTHTHTHMLTCTHTTHAHIHMHTHNGARYTCTLKRHLIRRILNIIILVSIALDYIHVSNRFDSVGCAFDEGDVLAAWWINKAGEKIAMKVGQYDELLPDR